VVVKDTSGRQYANVQDLADVLWAAEVERRPVAPLTDACPDLTLDEAYRIQQLNIERRRAAGETVIGHKIGLTGKPMQEKFGVSEPDYGHLMDTMQIGSAGPIDLDLLIDPQIEVEPAFVLGRELDGPGLTIADVIAATEYVVACYEIIDSRIIDWNIRLQDTVADNGSSARFVLGTERVRPGELMLDDLETVLELDGRTMDTGNTRAILGHPARGIAWLGNRLSDFGVTLEAGHVLLPGTCIRCSRLAGHRRVRGTISGLGSVDLEIMGTPFVTNAGP
jgi:2-keto-4-pentenoate hydratase